jgi:hypothetical protein
VAAYIYKLAIPSPNTAAFLAVLTSLTSHQHLIYNSLYIRTTHSRQASVWLQSHIRQRPPHRQRQWATASHRAPRARRPPTPTPPAPTATRAQGSLRESRCPRTSSTIRLGRLSPHQRESQEKASVVDATTTTLVTPLELDMWALAVLAAVVAWEAMAMVVMVVVEDVEVSLSNYHKCYGADIISRWWRWRRRRRVRRRWGLM